MKVVRLRGTIDVKIEVPDCISLEELNCKFKEHAVTGRYYLKSVKILKEDKHITEGDEEK